MIYKLILRLIVCFIGIILLNVSTYYMLLGFPGDPSLSWAGAFFSFLKSFLFKSSINGFNYSIILSVIGFLAFGFWDYFNNKDVHENKSLRDLLSDDLPAIFSAIILLPVIIYFSCILLMVSEIAFGIVLEFPYSNGWELVFDTRYFNNPFTFLAYFDEHERYIPHALYLWCFYACLFKFFSKESKYTNKEEMDLTTWQNTLKKISKKIPFAQIYLIYLIPMIFVWLYPNILYWLNSLHQDPKLNRFPELLEIYNPEIPFFYKLLGYFFIPGLVFTIYRILKHNTKTMILDLKQEIKNELINEAKNSL